jgi:sugar phosphate isomerase/epimerase
MRPAAAQGVAGSAKRRGIPGLKRLKFAIFTRITTIEMINRRIFLARAGAGLAAAAGITPLVSACSSKKGAPETAAATAPFFKISLAEWSLNRSLFGGRITNLDFPGVAKNEFGIDAVEYVNQFFADKAQDKAYLGELKQRCDDLGVQNVLIMIDMEGYLAEADEPTRIQAVENHYKWVEAARFLGCHAIRVNAFATATEYEPALQAAVDGLGRLSEFAAPYGISILVENHGGFSSNGQWLGEVMRQVGRPNCGTLPDFGNFCLKRSEPTENTIEAWMATVCLDEYDRYKGMEELMPYAKGVSAKAYIFDAGGNEPEIDFERILRIVKQAGYTGHIGIEFEGQGDETEGIKATRDLLIRLGTALA